jgi:hypothetical protein
LTGTNLTVVPGPSAAAPLKVLPLLASNKPLPAAAVYGVGAPKENVLPPPNNDDVCGAAPKAEQTVVNQCMKLSNKKYGMREVHNGQQNTKGLRD